MHTRNPPKGLYCEGSEFDCVRIVVGLIGASLMLFSIPASECDESSFSDRKIGDALAGIGALFGLALFVLMCCLRAELRGQVGLAFSGASRSKQLRSSLYGLLLVITTATSGAKLFVECDDHHKLNFALGVELALNGLVGVIALCHWCYEQHQDAQEVSRRFEPRPSTPVAASGLPPSGTGETKEAGEIAPV